jgi:hypothetical protein
VAFKRNDNRLQPVPSNDCDVQGGFLLLDAKGFPLAVLVAKAESKKSVDWI